METDPHAPASPIVCETNHGLTLSQCRQFVGVTKRELFAALIHAGLAANPNRDTTHDQDAEDAVRGADQLVDALSRIDSGYDDKDDEPPFECQHDWQPTNNPAAPQETRCAKCGETVPF